VVRYCSKEKTLIADLLVIDYTTKEKMRSNNKVNTQPTTPQAMIDCELFPGK